MKREGLQTRLLILAVWVLANFYGFMLLDPDLRDTVRSIVFQ